MAPNYTLFLLAGLVVRVLAQTTTTCNPLNTTCPSDPALGTTFFMTFNSSMTEFDPQLFNVSAGLDLISFSDNGADLTISEEGQLITIQTAFYIFFGQVEVVFQAAAGTGIISTFDMLSDDLDEIDWEIIGSNTTTVENNYYGHGNQSQRFAEYPSTVGSTWNGGAAGGFHNYTVNWSNETIQWILDGNVVRTLPYAASGLYPQTPSYLKFGIWPAGDPGKPNGTIAWAGGPCDWSKGPFTMTVQSIKVIDAQTNVSTYTYGDRSGSSQSIISNPGNSSAYLTLHKLSTTQEAVQHWNGLSKNAKIAIACSVVGAFAIFVIAFSFYCISQRKKGRNEKAVADKAWDAQHAELMEYRNRMKRGDFAIHHMGHGEKF